jgi:hypothetical protein
MSSKCNKGITIPTLAENPCPKGTISTKCVLNESAITYLSTPPNEKQSVINDKLVLSLADARSRIVILETNPASTPDATTTIKGKIKLAGDLSGTADLPTVPNKVDKVTGKSLISDAEITRLSTVVNFDNTANQQAINDRVVKNASIVGATKTKITYDAKGLVVSGADATTADIATSPDRNYVTDANLASITNLIGVNTGDQTSIVGITGTKAQFNTALTDGDFLFAGDVVLPPIVAVTDLPNGTVAINSGYGIETAIRPINELSLLAGNIDNALDKLVLYDASTDSHVFVTPAIVNAPEIFRNNGALSGVAPSPYKVGIDYSTGTQYYVNTAGNWAAFPSSTTVVLTDLTNGTVSINAGLGGTQTAIRPINELPLLSGNVDNALDKLLLFDASTGTHVYVTPEQLSSNVGNIVFTDYDGGIFINKADALAYLQRFITAPITNVSFSQKTLRFSVPKGTVVGNNFLTDLSSSWDFNDELGYISKFGDFCFRKNTAKITLTVGDVTFGASCIIQNTAKVILNAGDISASGGILNGNTGETQFNIKRIVMMTNSFQSLFASPNNRIGSMGNIGRVSFFDYKAYNPLNLVPQKGRLILETPYIGTSLALEFNTDNFLSPDMLIICPYEALDQTQATLPPIDGDLLNAYNNGVRFRSTL